jgi:predicted metalloprotease with PDZ domain
MLQYKISSYNPVTHYLQIEFKFRLKGQGALDLVLPAWRPGRYEGANYVKNIRNLKIEDPSGESIPYQKTSVNTWRLHPKDKPIKVTYSYFAFQPDAGASYIDDELWIINFLSCLIYPDGLELDPCLLEVELPENWQSATTLDVSGNNYYAENYYELTDRPLLAAKKLTHLNYNVQDTPFHLYIYGQAPVDFHDITPSFEAFSKAQLETFKSYPFGQYYFLIVILPFRFYHGVEHADNTVLVLGIDEGGNPQKFVDDLLGVSSHELFHTWNIKKIRPRELLSYNFRDFTLFNTGMIAEGFTTYYGDLFLVRSKVWDINRYLQELNLFLKRHYRNPGRHYASLTASSENLWIDGYKPGAPFHKVSIYVKGAIVAFMLDLKIRLHSNHRNSLDDIMRWMNEEVSNNGYTLDDLQRKAEELTNVDFHEFFQNYAYGTISISEELEYLCTHFGLELTEQRAEDPLERYYGIATSLKNDHLLVEMIDLNSPAEDQLSLGDQIMFINDEKPVEALNEKIEASENLQLKLKRLGRVLQVNVIRTEKDFFSFYQLKRHENSSQEQVRNLEKWLLQ